MKEKQLANLLSAKGGYLWKTGNEAYKDFIVPGDDRYERALQVLDRCKKDFSISDAFTLLHTVRQEGAWATRVSFVYSANERAVYYTENNHFEHIRKFIFPSA